MSETLQEQVYAFTRQILPGQVVSYGTVAANCPPLTPRQVGQLMALAPDDGAWSAPTAPSESDGAIPCWHSSSGSCLRQKACPSTKLGELPCTR